MQVDLQSHDGLPTEARLTVHVQIDRYDDQAQHLGTIDGGTTYVALNALGEPQIMPAMPE